MARASPSQRFKLNLLLGFASLALFFYAIARVSPVVVDPYDPLGLVSHLPPAYWIGLALLLVASVLAYLDRDLQGDGLFLFLLLALGLFLFGTGVLAYDSPRDPSAYYPTGEARTLLATGHLDIESRKMLVSYYSWPAIHFLTAALTLAAGVDLDSILKHAPLFWVAGFALIAYGLGKRLALSPRGCFLLAFLTLSSWMVGYAGTYSPRSLGMLLYLALLMLLLTPRQGVAERLAAILIFPALVLSHGLATTALLAGLVTVAVYRRRSNYVAPFLVIFGAWYTYQATLAMEAGVQQWWSAPLFDIFKLAEAERYEVASVTARAVNRYSQLCYLALWASLVGASALVLLRRWREKEHRERVIPLFAWSFGVALMVLLNYGGEGPYRLYLFALLPAAGIVVLSLSWRPVLVAAMGVAVVLFPLASYSADAGYSQVLTTELKGAKFFASQVRPPQYAGVLFYGTDPALMYYYDPNMTVEIFTPGFHGPRSPEKVDPAIMNPFHWIIISRQATNSLVYAWRQDPYAAWPETPVGRGADLIYSNGDFRIYVNTAYMQFFRPGR